MFRGRYEHSVDDKGRLSIPSRFREILARRRQRMLILTDVDSCVAAYPLDEWRQLEERIRKQSTLQKDVRAFLRIFYSGATESPMDGQGRILIPPHLRERAGLTREVMIIGVLNKMEIWSKARWEEFLARSPVTFEDVAARLADLGI
ncbi:MAG: division/cell wall cluster transcriptional repressor MraZ [candidate division NC10 bacterium]|nr:division/cell wall cluster transcriptional repressor MraZ [candidate division NC10 bacterium]MBI4391590.1 division/cell wall cluster transcriptional repressor MraZ [candidate division NC10 bacterium]